MTAPSDTPSETLDAAVVHALEAPRQRWRVTFGRDRPADDEIPTGREYVGRWEDSLLATGLPVLLLASGRPRVALGAPLPSGCSAEGELVEIWLTEIRPAWAVREALLAAIPLGHRLVDLQNVWLGAPALSGQVAAADYRVTAAAPRAAREEVQAAAERLLAHASLPRKRLKGGETRIYDLRPLVIALGVGPEPTGAASALTLLMRTRIHPELGTGRPDEVVAALASELGGELTIERTVRERLRLVDELADQAAPRASEDPRSAALD